MIRLDLAPTAVLSRLKPDLARSMPEAGACGGARWYSPPFVSVQPCQTTGGAPGRPRGAGRARAVAGLGPRAGRYLSLGGRGSRHSGGEKTKGGARRENGGRKRRYTSNVSAGAGCEPSAWLCLRAGCEPPPPAGSWRARHCPAPPVSVPKSLERLTFRLRSAASLSSAMLTVFMFISLMSAACSSPFLYCRRIASVADDCPSWPGSSSKSLMCAHSCSPENW